MRVTRCWVLWVYQANYWPWIWSPGPPDVPGFQVLYFGKVSERVWRYTQQYRWRSLLTTNRYLSPCSASPSSSLRCCLWLTEMKAQRILMKETPVNLSLDIQSGKIMKTATGRSAHFWESWLRPFNRQAVGSLSDENIDMYIPFLSSCCKLWSQMYLRTNPKSITNNL